MCHTKRCLGCFARGGKMPRCCAASPEKGRSALGGFDTTLYVHDWPLNWQAKQIMGGGGNCPSPPPPPRWRRTCVILPLTLPVMKGPIFDPQFGEEFKCNPESAFGIVQAVATCSRIQTLAQNDSVLLNYTYNQSVCFFFAHGRTQNYKTYTVRAPVFGRHQFVGTSEHYGKAHGNLLSGYINYNYTVCCWFPTSSNILILPSQFWQIRFESYWLHSSKCRILVLFWYDSLYIMFH